MGAICSEKKNEFGEIIFFFIFHLILIVGRNMKELVLLVGLLVACVVHSTSGECD